MKIKAELDGRVYDFTVSPEFLSDTALWASTVSSIRTPPFTEEEISEWQKYDKMLDDPNFWESARRNVKVVPKTENEVGYWWDFE